MNIRMFNNLLPIAALSFMLCACVAPKQQALQPVRTPFIEAEFEPYGLDGTGTITGQAFLKTRGGDIKLGAGNQVQLVPVTSYTTEGRNRVTIGGERLEPADPRIEKYRRTTIADGSGNFEFRNLPAGDYYITCVIAWEVPSQYGMETTGGIAYGTAKVKAGEMTKVVVTR